MLGIEVRIACPKGFEPNSLVIKKAKEINNTKDLLKISNDVTTAVKGAHVLYTDVWTSMGEETKKDKKDEQFLGFTINEQLLRKLTNNAIVLHCLQLIDLKK